MIDKKLLDEALLLRPRPVAIEALWDGDTRGWFVELLAVLSSGDTHTARYLRCFDGGGDIRLFDGQVPFWPEAKEADAVGRELAEALGVPFFFPSPHPKTNVPTGGNSPRAIRASTARYRCSRKRTASGAVSAMTATCSSSAKRRKPRGVLKSRQARDVTSAARPRRARLGRGLSARAAEKRTNITAVETAAAKSSCTGTIDRVISAIAAR